MGNKTQLLTPQTDFMYLGAIEATASPTNAILAADYAISNVLSLTDALLMNNLELMFGTNVNAYTGNAPVVAVYAGADAYVQSSGLPIGLVDKVCDLTLGVSSPKSIATPNILGATIYMVNSVTVSNDESWGSVGIIPKGANIVRVGFDSVGYKHLKIMCSTLDANEKVLVWARYI